MRNLLCSLALTGAAVGTLAAPAVHASEDPSNVCPNPIRMADTGIEGMGPLAEAFGPFAETFEQLSSQIRKRVM